MGNLTGLVPDAEAEKHLPNNDDDGLGETKNLAGLIKNIAKHEAGFQLRIFARRRYRRVPVAV